MTHGIWDGQYARCVPAPATQWSRPVLGLSTLAQRAWGEHALRCPSRGSPETVSSRESGRWWQEGCESAGKAGALVYRVGGSED